MSSRTWHNTASALVETDRMDREAMATAKRRVRGLSEVIESGSTLLPHFDMLAQDIFATFYKFNVIKIGDIQGSASQLVAERVLQWVLTSPKLEETKEVTRLDPLAAGVVTKRTIERLIETLKQRAWFDERDLLNQWKLKAMEDELQSLSDKQEALEQLMEAARQEPSEDAEEDPESQEEDERTEIAED
ncbi:MAG: hypothetical protein KC561_07050 [Myxococcales bacterium]|nr:hypothetical protein [Myxococcales bacterium]